MPAPETNILDRGEKELEQIFERMRRNCEDALAILRHINLEELSTENREHVYSQIHTLREMVRIFSPDFEKKLISDESPHWNMKPVRSLIAIVKVCRVWLV